MIFGLNDFWEFPFLLNALICIILLGIICGLLGPVIIAKRFAFMGASVSHSSLLGVAISLSFFQVSHGTALFLITLLITLVLTLFLAISSYQQKVPNDTLIGIFYTTSMGLGMLIYQEWGQQNGDLLSFLFGNILIIQKIDIYFLLVTTLIVLLIFYKNFHKICLYLYDEQMAKVQGLNTKLYHFTFYLLLTLVIVASIKIAGTILINALLLIPGFFALKLAKNVKQTFFFSTLFSVLSSVFFLALSNYWNLSVGPSIGVGQFILLLLFFVLNKLAQLLRK